MKYFNEIYGAGEATGYDIASILTLIADRYIADNPPQPFIFHSYRRNVFLCGRDGRFLFNLNNKFPESVIGTRVVVEAKFWQENPREEYFAINCYSPVTVEIGGIICFRSGVEEEVDCNIKRKFAVTCKQGWNTVRLCIQKTKSGFGCIFGVNEPKWRWKPFYSNVLKEEGGLGFRYQIEGEREWLPNPEYAKDLEKAYPVSRIFGGCQDRYVYGGTQLIPIQKENPFSLKLECGPETEVYVYLNGELVHTINPQKHAAIKEILLPPLDGKVFLVIRGKHTGINKDWGWRILEEAIYYHLNLPIYIKGTRDNTIYIGPFTNPREDLTISFDPEKIYSDGEEKRYFELDAPDTTIRPVLENLLFARWNYPLGVTMYGLMTAARYLNEPHIMAYVEKHISICISYYAYAVWDQETYGYPEVNTQLLNISMLDDCGSFANCILEFFQGKILSSQVKKVTDIVADYISDKQERREDGAFYRICKGNFMEDTLWADDLYMSIPFLCRYYQLTGNIVYAHDAVNQILQFKKYLYMPEENLMSHVYDFKYQTATELPWGRGNGWVFFSLTELLAVLPQEDVYRQQLIDFFCILADGYMERQLSDGMWPQLLNVPDSYPETSCTAMFICGLCRGIRCGWLKKNQYSKAWEAARSGWKALTDTAIDRKGNVYGVCEGSAYSYKPEYYTKELGWILNDPHGTGIVLLAGIELQKMMDTEVLGL